MSLRKWFAMAALGAAALTLSGCVAVGYDGYYGPSYGSDFYIGSGYYGGHRYRPHYPRYERPRYERRHHYRYDRPIIRFDGRSSHEFMGRRDHSNRFEHSRRVEHMNRRSDGRRPDLYRKYVETR